LLGQEDIPSSDDASDDGVDYFQTGNFTTSFIILQLRQYKQLFHLVASTTTPAPQPNKQQQAQGTMTK